MPPAAISAVFVSFIAIFARFRLPAFVCFASVFFNCAASGIGSLFGVFRQLMSGFTDLECGRVFIAELTFAFHLALALTFVRAAAHGQNC